MTSNNTVNSNSHSSSQGTQCKDLQNGNSSGNVAMSSSTQGVAAGMSEASDDSSLNSIDLDPIIAHLDSGATYIDSDTGLESMSSAEATIKACSMCMDGSQAMCSSPSNETVVIIENLRQEVTRLKCDKLDLLRQNVVSTESNQYIFFNISLKAPLFFRRPVNVTLNVYVNGNFRCKEIWPQPERKFYV